MQQGQCRSGLTYKVMVASPERDLSLCCCNSEDTINQVAQQAVLMSLIPGLLHRQRCQTALILALIMGCIGSTSTHASCTCCVRMDVVHFSTKHQISHHDDKKEIQQK